jgi:hypothetical protein
LEALVDRALDRGAVGVEGADDVLAVDPRSMAR